MLKPPHPAAVIGYLTERETEEPAMKLLLKIFLALTVVSIVSNVVPSPFASWAQDTAYENCTDLRADWPSGVARNEKAAQKISAAGTEKPRVHAGTHRLNERLDANNNGVVCENKKTGTQLIGDAIRKSTQFQWRSAKVR